MQGLDAIQSDQLITDLEKLRADLLHIEKASHRRAVELDSAHTASARNLLHYLALRRHDLRALQDQLAALGLSSLGRSEACVLASLEAVQCLLHRLTRRPELKAAPPAVTFAQGRALLAQHTEALLGKKPPRRSVRIMVTMPPEAAHDYGLVRDLLAGGMDCMRVNCAHDGAEGWGRMIAHLRRAEEETGRSCRVLMDLPGPKLRTGALEAGPQVVKWKPQRDCLGRVTAPARLWLTAADEPEAPPGPAAACLPVCRDWLALVTAGDQVRLADARGARRCLHVGKAAGRGRWLEAEQTAYVTSGTRLHLYRAVKRGRSKVAGGDTRVGQLAPREIPLSLHVGDVLVLTRIGRPGRPARGRAPARISCTLPEVFADLRPDQRVWFDDGKIGGIIRAVTPDQARVEITRADPNGSKLGADKGINLPDTALRLPPLTSQDLGDLAFIAASADLVGFSFVRHPADVHELQARLAECGGQRLGLVLKIETAQAFEQLPELLLAAMRSRCVGVMIARGDLAIECGWERLAELQEEILWVCEAAHVPVIWATQVLEHLAKDGMPSRAEITDAAMGERAECVMLNKGPHIQEALQMLDNILRRMEGHQNKKRPMLRRLNLANHFPVPVVRPRTALRRRRESP